MNGSTRMRATLRLLGLIGAMNMAFFCVYNIPMQWIALHVTHIQQDVLNRTYFLDGICGQGTTQACSDSRSPLPLSPHAAHATPDGTITVPAPLPIQIPEHPVTPG